MRGCDIYSDPNKVSILPKAVKVSGTTVTGLIKWIAQGTPYDTNKYFYDHNGKIYREASDGSWSVLRTVTNSVGQGLAVVNDYLYYTQNTQIGRYGPLSGTPSFTDNWQTGLTNTSTTGFAPICPFLAGFAVGHGNKLGWWDGATWTPNQLTLPPGLHIRSLEVVDEFLMIGTWRGNSITDSEEGYVFVWDGVSSNPNFFFANPEGAANALLNSKNRLLSIWGSSGYIYQGYSPFEKIHQLPKLALGSYVEVFPGAVTNWKGLALFGFAGNTDSSSIEQGVYSYGSKSSRFPEVLNYMFPISTGTKTGTNLKIGALKGIGNYLYIAWQDGTSYGVDRVTNSGAPQSSALIEQLIFDNGDVFTDKLAKTIKVKHNALASGESIQIGYKRNRAPNYTFGPVNLAIGSTETRLTIPPSDARFKEWQISVILSTTSSTSPVVTGIGFQFDNLKEEKGF